MASRLGVAQRVKASGGTSGAGLRRSRSGARHATARLATEMSAPVLALRKDRAEAIR